MEEERIPGMLVRFRPSGPWRIGPDSGARDRVDHLLHSDVLYSAVCSAMRQLGLLEEWLAATARAEGEPAVRFSSCFPWQEDELFVVPPRHIWPPPPSAKVRWKGARFVPLSLVSLLLADKTVDEERWVVDPASGCLLPAQRRYSSGPFRVAVRSSAAIDRLSPGITDTHATACLEFAERSGMWCAVVFGDGEARQRWAGPVKSALRLLADSGVGGERSRGWGRSSSPSITEGPFPALLLPRPREPKRVPETGARPAEPAADHVSEPAAETAVEMPAVDAIPEGVASVEPALPAVSGIIAEAEPLAEAATAWAAPPSATAEEAAPAEPGGDAVELDTVDHATAVEPAPASASAEAPAVAALSEAAAEPEPEPSATAGRAPELPDEPVCEQPAAADTVEVGEPVSTESETTGGPEASLEASVTLNPEAPAEFAGGREEPADEKAAAAEEPAEIPMEAPPTAIPEAAGQSSPAPAVPAPPAAPPITAWWLLSLFSPGEDEVVDWARGNYALVTRSGRVESAARWGELKKSVRMVCEGSVIISAVAPRGTAPDVAPDGFPHPVYRAGFAFAIPIPWRMS